MEEGAVLEEGGFFEVAAAFELGNGFVDKFFFVDDMEGERADDSDGEEETSEEEEVAVYVCVSAFDGGEEVASYLALPHATQAECCYGHG